MSPRKTMLLAAAAAAMLCGTKAFSAIIISTDPNAISGFHGTEDFSTSIGTLSMKGAVDYAAYAPGKFNQTFGAGSDPSNNQRYVYAYQLRNTGGTADRDLGFLSVGLDGAAGNTPANIGILLTSDNGDDPSSSSFIPAGGPPFDSATWNFANTIPDNHSSEILLFTSPLPPEFYNASVQGGGLSNQKRLPSPNPVVPEPGTALAACGFVGALLIRRRNSK